MGSYPSGGFSLRQWETDYEVAHAVIGHTFRFAPDDLWNLTEDDMQYWMDRAKDVTRIFYGKT